MSADQPIESTGGHIVSPFADTEGVSVKKTHRGHFVGWAILGTILLLALAIGGFAVARHLNDPLRTLEPFPVAKYLESYKAVAGSKFRANLRVENDLGWKEGTGRLMVFSLRDDPRPVVVMIPPGLAQTHFTKGQNYEGELEVKEGGLIYANSMRKN